MTITETREVEPQHRGGLGMRWHLWWNRDRPPYGDTWNPKAALPPALFDALDDAGLVMADVQVKVYQDRDSALAALARAVNPPPLGPEVYVEEEAS